MLVICDIDGTLSNCAHRAHLVEGENPDWEAFLKPELVSLDTPIEGAKLGLEHFKSIGANIVFLTGRNEGLREVTTKWLKDHMGFDVNDRTLFMRPIGDQRVPSEFKRSVLNKMVYWNMGNWITIDDDKYLQQVYRDFNAVALWAPDCWKVLFHIESNLPPELSWRK